MVQTASIPTSIIRTERGLTLSGTRITLYDLLISGCLASLGWLDLHHHHTKH